MDRKAKMLAAALAAVNAFLAEEAAATRVAMAAPATGSASPWLLAGRLSVMATRFGAAPRRRG